MKDESTTVAELRARVLAFVRARDWEQFHSPKNLSMALAAEAGELMEHFLWSDSKASGETVRDPAEVAAGLKRGLAETRRGRPAVTAVWMPRLMRGD